MAVAGRACREGMARWPYVVGEGCAGQIFKSNSVTPGKQPHYRLYTAQVSRAEWHYLRAVSSSVATAGKSPPSPSSPEGQEWPS